MKPFKLCLLCELLVLSEIRADNENVIHTFKAACVFERAFLTHRTGTLSKHLRLPCLSRQHSMYYRI